MIRLPLLNDVDWDVMRHVADALGAPYRVSPFMQYWAGAPWKPPLGVQLYLVEPEMVALALLAPGDAGQEWLRAYQAGASIYDHIAEKVGLQHGTPVANLVGEFLADGKLPRLLRITAPWLSYVYAGIEGELIAVQQAVLRHAVCQAYKRGAGVPTYLNADTVMGSAAYLHDLQGFIREVGFRAAFTDGT